MELTVKMQYELLELAMSTDEKVRNSYEKLIPYIKGTVHDYLIDLIFEGNKKAYNAINKAYRAGGSEREKIADAPMGKYKLFNRSAMGLSRAIKRVQQSVDSVLLDYEEFLFLTGLDTAKIKAITVALPEGLTQTQVEKIVEKVEAVTTSTTPPEAITAVTNAVVSTTAPTSTPAKKKRKVNPPSQEKLTSLMEEVEVEVGLKALIAVAKKKGKLGLAAHLEALIGEAMVSLDVVVHPDDDESWDDF